MKKSLKWKIGVGFIVLQVIALLGNLSILMVMDIRSLFNLIGFCLPAIIGAILLTQDKKNRENK